MVVIDMVPFFLADSANARGIVPNINRLATSLRSRGGTVAWVAPRHGPPSPWETAFFGSRVAAAYAASGGTETVEDRIAPHMATHPEDVYVEKSASSAFFPGRSNLDATLHDRGIDTVIIAGTVTSVCCESSARDAATLGYRVIFPGDANADVSDDAHNATLRTIYRSFGDVRTTDDVVALIAGRSAPG